VAPAPSSGCRYVREFGDALLHEIARVLTKAIPEGAEAARLGGDEFVVMLPAAGADAAEALGGEVRRLLAAGLTDAGWPAIYELPSGDDPRAPRTR
jgi:GGDEF domain-containing protein